MRTFFEKLLSAVSAALLVFCITGCKKDHHSTGSKEPEYVDLGLPSGTLWAKCNLGADDWKSAGSPYAWGEVRSGKSFDWENYSLCNGDAKSLKKYNNKEDCGDTDTYVSLRAEDDAANSECGQAWRIPLLSDWMELFNPSYCNWEWIDDDAACGALVTSKMVGYTDKSIFLPVAGYFSGDSNASEETGYYWSSELNLNDPTKANSAKILKSLHTIASEYRCLGLFVRPVRTRAKEESSSSDKTLIVRPSLEDGLQILEGASFRFTATLYPDGDPKEISWSSNDLDVLYMDGGLVTGLAPGYATIKVSWGSKNAYIPVRVLAAPNHAYVDMGTKVLWATCNVGASSAEATGQYFAWAEKESKSNYNEGSYSWYDADKNILKYNLTRFYGGADGRGAIMPEDDPARWNWGGTWHTPSYEDWQEIQNSDKFNWTYNTKNGVSGAEITNRQTNKSIFLPGVSYMSGASVDVVYNGRGYYWSSTLVKNSPYYAFYTYFDPSRSEVNEYYYEKRYRGLPVRPVKDK